MLDNRLPLGEYYIGDPCYVISNDEWASFCESMDKGAEGKAEGFMTHKGVLCYATGTMYGDGTYNDQGDGEYPVDSGTIGCTPKCLWTKELQHTLPANFGVSLAVFIDEGFECKNENGVITIAGRIIDTNGEEDDDACDECGWSGDDCCCDEVCPCCGWHTCECDDDWDN